MAVHCTFALSHSISEMAHTHTLHIRICYAKPKSAQRIRSTEYDAYLMRSSSVSCLRSLKFIMNCIYMVDGENHTVCVCERVPWMRKFQLNIKLHLCPHHVWTTMYGEIHSPLVIGRRKGLRFASSSHFILFDCGFIAREERFRTIHHTFFHMPEMRLP